MILLMLEIYILLIEIELSLSFLSPNNDYDLYGIKIGINDRLMVSADNLNMVWYVTNVVSENIEYTPIYYNRTKCQFVYNVIVPIVENLLFAYNCIGHQGENLIGFFHENGSFSFSLMNEQTISNYSTQDNFIINIDRDGTGIYGIADDFILYYKLHSSYTLIIWPNTLNISPRAFDIGENMNMGVIVGYCQIQILIAEECSFIIQLSQYLSCPQIVNQISISKYIKFRYSDPRTNHLIRESRSYSSSYLLSVSINWNSRRILIGIPSLNIVLLYSIDDVENLNGIHDHGIGTTGFGKSVAWLDDRGEKAAILSNIYSYISYQWMSSSIHIYDIQSDGFSDQTNPILIYPNSEQVIFPWVNPSLIRLICSPSGHLALFDVLGNAAIIYSSPPGTYPDTNSPSYTSIIVPCINGTYRNYRGIELCFPCPHGTYSKNCSKCLSKDSFCPMGSIEEISYSIFQSIEQDQDYPESPESTTFDDILMQNIFSLNTKSVHCVVVSPITWVVLVMVIGLIVAITVIIHEIFGPKTHLMRDWTKQLLRRVDIIGEGEVMWIFPEETN